LHLKPALIKLGRIDGKIVLSTLQSLQLSPFLPAEDKADYETAKKTPQVAIVEPKEEPLPEQSGEEVTAKQEPIQPVEQPELYVGKQSTKYPRGIRKWGNRCRECKSYYIHLDQTCCSTQTCPQRCPPRLRPQYRPKEEVKPVEEAAAEPIKKTRSYRKRPTIEEAAKALEKGSKNHLPPVPAFDSGWSTLVQEAWLLTYYNLRKIEVKQ
jgi:hypothetical protein